MVRNHHYKRYVGFRSYFVQHAQACISSLGRLYRAPMATLMTLSVIAIALALPTFLYLLLKNGFVLSEGWNNNAQISLYIKPEVSLVDAQSLAKKIQTWPEVASVKFISPAEGLVLFEHQSGFSDVLKQLPDNPLPAVIALVPNSPLKNLEAIQPLLTKLKQLPQVDLAQLDMEWVQRLYAILAIATKVVYMLAFLLAAGVLLIIGNTIRLTMEAYHAEIETIKLVGGTNGFIRRPFLYAGFSYGLLGGIIASFLITIAEWSLKNPVNYLASLYNSSFKLQELSACAIIWLLLISALLGLIGAWVAVNRHLLTIEPS